MLGNIGNNIVSIASDKNHWSYYEWHEVFKSTILSIIQRNPVCLLLELTGMPKYVSSDINSKFTN